MISISAKKDAILAAEIRSDLQAIAHLPKQFSVMCHVSNGEETKTVIIEANSDRFVDVMTAMQSQYPGWMLVRSLF